MRLDRRDFLKITGVASLFAVSGNLFAAAPKTKGPNILYILTDQWRAQALSCAGDTNLKTPHIDKLAKQGVHLTNAYSNSPVCTPHRAMLMSGRYPSHTKTWKNNELLPPAEHCIAEHFAQAGYQTGYIGKWHIDGPAKPGNVQHRQGWKYWAGFNRGHAFNNGVYFTDSDNKIKVPDGVFEPVHQTDLAIDFIKTKTKGDAPWFMMVSYGGPHMPYTAPKEYMDKVKPDEFSLRPNVKNMSDRHRKALHGYYAHCMCLDDCIGRLTKMLGDLGIDDDTLVCFTSDHGDLHRSQGESYKSKPWEESIGVPFIARWPKVIQAGRKTDSLLSTIDIYPTLCGLCKLDKPKALDGSDISHLFTNTAGKDIETAYLTIGEPDREGAWRGIRTKQYTYAWFPNKKVGYILYDNLADPYQMNNMVDKPEHKDLQKKMHGIMLGQMKAMNEPLYNKMIS